MRAFIRHPFAIGVIAIFCIAGMAVAAEMPPLFEGRWLSNHHKLTFDISRCGTGWCGVEVMNGSACGRVVLNLDAIEQQANDYTAFSGRLQLSEESEPYGVHAIFQNRGGILTLKLSGHTGGKFLVFRRTYDFEDVFARIDNPICQSDNKVS